MDADATQRGRAWWVPALMAVAWGAAAWILGALATGKREPWDSSAYWIGVYPVSLLGGALLARWFPRRAWRWPLLVFFGQFVGVTLLAGEVGNLWPLAIALFAFLSLPGIALAGWVARARSAA